MKDENSKKFAEVVFDLTLIARYIFTEMLPDSREIDSRDVFDEIYDLAREFEFGGKDAPPDYEYEDDGNYLNDIEEFGMKRLGEYFGLDV